MVAIPPGAIAVLCIQRTLSKSRKSGFISGLGAASANTLSATIAAFFLGIVLPFIEKNIELLKIILGICVIVLGVITFFKNPVMQIRQNKEKKETLRSDFVSVFLIAIVNPAFILTYMAFFALFGVDSDISYFSGSFILAGVFIGASMWWFTLTTCIAMLRNKFRPRYLLYLNRTAGILIVLLGLVAVLSFLIG
ncbi:MAG: LysE family transporter [Bacteroidales bacterium]|nr:LysE family transporter [Bacteroidales bacterium]